MSLEHLVITESKEVLKKDGASRKDVEVIWKELPMAKSRIL